MMLFIDSHSHLDFAEFDHDREAVIQRALKAGVTDMIVSATTADRWEALKASVKNQPHCHPAYGLHPMFMAEHTAQHLDKLNDWLQQETSVAVAEIGLDFFIEEANEAHRSAQLDLFIAQLDIANGLDLPVIIHARKSQDYILKYLRQYPDLRGSIHSFSGSQQQANQLIDCGFYLSFGGPITYTRATRLRALIKKLPLESLLLETDAPDQPDALHYAQRNEPAYLPHIAKAIAQLKGLEVAQVAEQTTKNAKLLFSLK